MKWMEVLKARAEEKTAPATLEPGSFKAPAEVFQTTYQVRPSNPATADPGEVVEVWFTLADGNVTPTGMDGKPIGAPIPCPPAMDPRSIARAEARKRWQGDARFRRPIEYPKRIRA